VVRGKERRTQAERRALTHGALLDAAADCLVERGYSNTSTNDIIRLAGVSRGALLHHFSSKAELLGATVEHVANRCEREFREAFAAMPVEERTLEQAVVQLWEIFRGPTFDAVLELLVAARTNAELRTVLQDVLARFERNVATDFAVLFPATASATDSRAIVRFCFAALQGAAIADDLGLDHEADDIVNIMRGLAATLSTTAPIDAPRPADAPIDAPTEEPVP
jgi:AcrR family transcriptional regulator